MADRPNDALPAGIGCRAVATIAAGVLVFAAVAAATGLSLLVDEQTSGATEAIAFVLYGAGLPVSGLFGMMAGDLPIAWPVDLTFWLVVSAAASRLAERRSIHTSAIVTSLIATALVWGTIVATLLERT